MLFLEVLLNWVKGWLSLYLSDRCVYQELIWKNQTCTLFLQINVLSLHTEQLDDHISIDLMFCLDWLVSSRAHWLGLPLTSSRNNRVPLSEQWASRSTLAIKRPNFHDYSRKIKGSCEILFALCHQLCWEYLLLFHTKWLYFKIKENLYSLSQWKVTNCLGIY